MSHLHIPELQLRKGLRTMKKDFFTALDALNANLESCSLTCLSPAYLGEKAICTGGEWAYREKPDGFFAELEGFAQGKVFDTLAAKASTGHPPAKLSLSPVDLDNVGGLELPSGCGIFQLAGETVYGERLGHEKKLIICGAGHVSIAIIKIAKLLGLHVICIEDRPSFADNARAAGADQVLCEDFETALKVLPSDGDSYFVIVTRGHRYDRDCLRIIAGKQHAYIGLMGSRRRVQLVKESLLAEGVNAEVLARVHTPIGLAIGAETPEEIAVSVMAEIIEVKNGAQKNFGFPEDILRAVIGGHHREPEAGKKVLCTIISRKGSAPRQVGTKMLLLSDGRCIGTIGGGCIEAEVVRRGRELFMEDEDAAKASTGRSSAKQPLSPVDIFEVDLTAEMASDEGMVCGGKVEVLLERICEGTE